MTKEPTQVKSITVKNVYGKVTKDDIGKNLMTVYGVATSLIFAQTKYGENEGLKGDFVAVNVDTGEIFTSSAAFLPAGLHDPIAKRIKEADDYLEVKFNGVISLAETDKNDRGYTYIADEPETEERKSRRETLLAIAKTESKKLLPKA